MREIPLDESKSGLSSLFGNEYFPAFESEEGYLKPDLSEEETEEFKDLLYRVVDREETFELARGKSDDVSYMIKVGPNGESAPYEVNVQITPSFSFSKLHDTKSLLGYDVESYKDIDEIAEAERKFEAGIKDKVSQIEEREGVITDAKFSHLTYSRLLKKSDISNPEEILEEAGKVTSEAFRYYGDFIEGNTR